MSAESPKPLLIDIVALSQLLHRSPASLRRDEAEGRLPAGFKMGGSKRWRLQEIREWVRAGMPCREETGVTPIGATDSASPEPV